MRCCREGGVDPGSVADAPIETDIARNLGRNLRRPRCASGGGGRDRGQWSIVHRHLFGGVEGLGAGLGDDQRDRLADIADLAGGQQRLSREGERLAGLNIGLGRGS
jgi:hypothetical protein